MFHFNFTKFSQIRYQQKSHEIAWKTQREDLKDLLSISNDLSFSPHCLSDLFQLLNSKTVEFLSHERYAFTNTLKRKFHCAVEIEPLPFNIVSFYR